jgi:acyl dehydratase
VTLAPELVGRTFPPTAAYLVTEERVAEFAAATGTPWTRGPAPVTFPIVVAFQAMLGLMADPGVGIALHRVVHGEQRFRYTRPVVPGDTLTATLTVESVRSLGGADVIGTRTELQDAAGQHVVTASAVLVHRGEDA